MVCGGGTARANKFAHATHYPGHLRGWHDQAELGLEVTLRATMITAPPTAGQCHARRGSATRRQTQGLVRFGKGQQARVACDLKLHGIRA